MQKLSTKHCIIKNCNIYIGFKISIHLRLLKQLFWTIFTNKMIWATIYMLSHCISLYFFNSYVRTLSVMSYTCLILRNFTKISPVFGDFHYKVKQQLQISSNTYFKMTTPLAFLLRTPSIQKIWLSASTLMQQQVSLVMHFSDLAS